MRSLSVSRRRDVRVSRCFLGPLAPQRPRSSAATCALAALARVLRRTMGCGASTAAPKVSADAAVIVEKKPPTVEAENAVIDPRVADAFKLIDKCAGALLVVGCLSTLAERCVCGSPRARGSHRDGDGVATKAEVLLALRKHESVRELLGLSAAKEGDLSLIHI